MRSWSFLTALSDILPVSSPDELAVVGEYLYYIYIVAVVFAVSHHQRYYSKYQCINIQCISGLV